MARFAFKTLYIFDDYVIFGIILYSILKWGFQAVRLYSEFLGIIE